MRQLDLAILQFFGVNKLQCIFNLNDRATSPFSLKQLLAKDWGLPLCVIGMGTLGTPTRTDFPRLGSCLTYGYLDTPVAPGQLSARARLDHLRPAKAGV